MNQALMNQRSVEASEENEVRRMGEPPVLPYGLGFYRRMTSYGLDLGIYYLLIFVLSIATSGMDEIARRAIDQTPFRADASFWTLLVELTLFCGYFTLFEWLYGATPGKLIMRMRVVQKDGRPCTLAQALVRAVTRPIDGFFFGSVAAFNMQKPLNQRWGDKRARTMVVSAEEPGIRDHRSWPRFVLASGSAVLLVSICCVLFAGLLP